VVAGALGYWAIERDWSFLESLYMAVISVTTVGFGEVRPLSAAGRVFTVAFLAANMLVTVYAATLLTSYILEGHLGGAIRRRRLERRLASMNGHVIVCGYGRVGRSAAARLADARISVLVVDKLADSVERAQHDGFAALEGGATDEDVLLQAGLDRAAGVIGALATDNDNITLALTVRDLKPDIPLVCRATGDTEARLLRRAGATHVLSPYDIAGARMATMLVQPEVLQFLDVAMEAGEATVRLESVPVEPGSRVAGKVLRETHCFADSGTIVVGCVAPDGGVTVNPPRSLRIEPGSTLIVMGDDGQLGRLRDMLAGGPHRPERSPQVAGGDAENGE